MSNTELHATTVVCVRRPDGMAMGSDGQVTLGQTVLKHQTRKIRRLYNGTILAGFAGSTSDAFALFERFEEKLKEYHGQLHRAAVELAKAWRTDRVLRRLEAMLIVADREHVLILTGSGDVVEPDEGVAAIGSGGPYAQAAALALSRHSTLSAREIVSESLTVAASICIYTNQHHTIEELS